MIQSLSVRAAPLDASRQSRYVMNSPLLFSVLGALATSARVEVLDLAPAHGGLLDYFARYHCKLYLPACRDALCRLSTKTIKADSLPRQLARLIPWTQQQPQPALTLVLLWDLPNYLHPDILAALINQLMPCLQRGTMLHTYIHTRQEMADQPGEFRLAGDKQIAVTMCEQWTRQSPMYHRELLHKVLDPFRVERGMLLSNGMQEYLLRR